MYDRILGSGGEYACLRHTGDLLRVPKVSGCNDRSQTIVQGSRELRQQEGIGHSIWLDSCPTSVALDIRQGFGAIRCTNLEYCNYVDPPRRLWANSRACANALLQVYGGEEAAKDAGEQRGMGAGSQRDFNMMKRVRSDDQMANRSGG